MPAPDSTIEEVRGSVLRYIRMYEEGQFTLGDLAAEIAVMAPAYEHAIGGIVDPYANLLRAADRYRQGKGAESYEELDEALTEFRRTDAAW